MMKIENRAFTLGELQIIAVANEETDYFEAELRKLIAAWRTMSDRDFLRTFNQGNKADGLEKAANDLEMLLECTQAESEGN